MDFRPATVFDLPAMRAGFHEAFCHAPEYANYPDERYADEVENYFHDFFHSRREAVTFVTSAVLLAAAAVAVGYVPQDIADPMHALRV